MFSGPTIHQASEDGDLNRIKELVAELPELKSKPDERGWTPLHTVAAFGHLDALKWLSVNGVNLKEETPTGYTPIHLAAMNGHVKCIMVCNVVVIQCPLRIWCTSGIVKDLMGRLCTNAEEHIRETSTF